MIGMLLATLVALILVSLAVTGRLLPLIKHERALIAGEICWGFGLFTGLLIISDDLTPNNLLTNLCGILAIWFVLLALDWKKLQRFSSTKNSIGGRQ